MPKRSAMSTGVRGVKKQKNCKKINMLKKQSVQRLFHVTDSEPGIGKMRSLNTEDGDRKEPNLSTFAKDANSPTWGGMY